MVIAGGRVAQLGIFASRRISLDAIWRPTTLIGAVALSYAYPLVALVRALQSDTPLAYLALVPLIGLAIGIWRYHQAHELALPQHPRGPRDLAIGSIVIVAAAWIGVGMPLLLDVLWFRPPRDSSLMLAFAASKRLDLLSLPVFAAGILIFLYGVAAVRWAWPAIIYCFLVWPYPYDYLLGHILPLISVGTATVVAHLGTWVSLGSTIDATDRSLFTIITPQGPQQVSIGSACSGFNSVVAWFLIACAIGVCICGNGRGARAMRAAPRLLCWFLIGIGATLLGNVIRILLLFAGARIVGFDTAFEWLHLSLGSVLFAIIVIIMVRALSPLGLVLPTSGRLARWPVPAVVSSSSVLQALFVAIAAVVLSIGIFLGIGILRLTLAFTAANVLFSLMLLGIAICSYVYKHLRRLSRYKRRFAVAGVTVGVFAVSMMVFIGATLLALHLKEIRAARIPALGWRIDWDQRALFSDSVRFGAVLLAVIVLVLLILRLINATHRSPEESGAASSNASPWWRWQALLAGSIIGGTLALVIVTTTIASYRAVPLVAGGVPVHDFDAVPPSLPDATWAFVQSYDWPKQSLGRTATYRRFRYDGIGEQPLWVDVVTTDDADALALHDVQSCYEVHGFLNDGARAVTIGHGAYATMISFRPSADESWSALYWEQHVVRDGKTFFQRIILLYALDGPPIGATSEATIEAKNAALQTWAEQLFDNLLSDSPVLTG